MFKIDESIIPSNVAKTIEKSVDSGDMMNSLIITPIGKK